MPASPFPITATETNEMITQMQSLMDDLYQNRLGGACVGDVFMVDDDDIFKLKYLAIGGLQKIAGSLAILPNTSKGIDCDRNGIFVVLEADKGLSFNGTSGIYVKLKTDNGLAVDTNGLYVKLKSGGGITVDADGLSTTAATPISGTWTASFTCGTSGTITLDASYQTGWYRKIDDLVFFGGRFVVSSVNSPLGSLTLGTLPYTSNSDIQYIPSVSLQWQTMNAGMSSYVAQVQQNTKNILIRGWAGTTATSLTAAAPYMKAGSVIYVNGSYIT
jgi:hypothetical protein